MNRIVKIVGISSIILLLIFLSTDPKGLPSVALVVPFMLLFIIIFFGILFVLGVYGVSRQRRLRVGLATAAIPVLLLVLKSLGQLTIRDVLAILVLFGATYFYMSRLGVQATN